jgi:hypothetical protein
MTRGDRAVQWIEKNCIDPETGEGVVVPQGNAEVVRRLFNDPSLGKPGYLPLSECLRQLFTFGPEAKSADEAERAYDARVGVDGWPVGAGSKGSQTA